MKRNPVVRKLVLILIHMAIVLFEKSKGIDRRQKGIGQMAYMHEGLIMRVSGAFYVFKTKLQGHGKSDLALFLFEKIVVRLVSFSKTAGVSVPVPKYFLRISGLFL